MTLYVFRYPTAAHCGCSVLFQKFYRHSLKLLYLLLGALPLITKVNLFLTRCFMLLSLVPLGHLTCLTVIHWVCLVLSDVSYFHSVKCFSIIPDVSHLLNGMWAHHLRCSIATHWVCLCHFIGPTLTNYSGSALSHAFHCYLLEWVYIVSGKHPFLLEWLHVISAASLLLTEVALCHFKDTTVTTWYGSAFFSDICLLLSGVALHHFRYTPPFILSWLCIISGVSLLLLGWLCIYSVIPLFLTGLTSCHPRYFDVVHIGGFTSGQVSHCNSPEWLCMVSCD